MKRLLIIDGAAPVEVDILPGQEDVFPPEPAVRPAVETLAFRMRFTRQERGAITVAAEVAMRGTPPDPTLRVFLDDLSAAGQFIYLDDPEVIQAVNMLAAAGLIAPERVAEVLAR